MSRFKPSPSQIASARVRDLQAKGRKIIKLTAGEPDFPAPDSAKQAVIELMERNEIQYTPVNGTLALRQAVQAKFQRDNDLRYDLDQIAVGTGSKQVLFNALMATVSAGDEVIIPGPYWTSYPDMVKLAGGTPVFVVAGQNEKFKVRPDELEAAITPKSKWLMICSPSNPTGAAYSWDELENLADVLLRHPHVHVLTDDVYEHLIFDSHKFATLAQAGCVGLSNAHRTIKNTLVLRRAFQYAHTFGLTVFINPQDPWLRGNGVMHEGETSTRLGL